MKVLRAFLLVAGLSGVALGGPVGPPGGSPILNQSFRQIGSVLNVDSGTIRDLSVSTLTFSDGTKMRTAASGSGGSSILPLPGGATNYVQTSNTLQPGATFYVSSGTVAGNLTVGNTPNGNLTLSPGSSGPTVLPALTGSNPGGLNIIDNTGQSTNPTFFAGANTAVNAPLGKGQGYFSMQTASGTLYVQDGTIYWVTPGSPAKKIGLSVLQPVTNSYTVYLPTAPPTAASQVMASTDTSGSLTWQTMAAGGSAVLQSSGIAFGSATSTPTAVPSQLRWTTQDGLYASTASFAGISIGPNSVNTTSGLKFNNKDNTQFLYFDDFLGTLGDSYVSTGCSGVGGCILDMTGVLVKPSVFAHSINNKFLTTDTNGYESDIDLMGSPNRWTGANTYTSSMTVAAPGGLGVTYGLSGGSLTLTGSGNSIVTEPNGLSGQVLIGTSTVNPTLGHLAVWGSSITLIDGGVPGTGGGTPGGPNLSVQVSSAGVFGGFANFTNDGSTITITSTGTIINSVGRVTETNVSSQIASGVYYDYSASTMTVSSVTVQNIIINGTCTGVGCASGGASTLEVMANGLRVSSPTASINAVGNAAITITGTLTGGSTAQLAFAANPSSVTLQGVVTAASLGALTANQSITLSGDSTGSGATAIAVTAGANQPNIKTLAASSTTVQGILAVSSFSQFASTITVPTSQGFTKGTLGASWDGGGSALVAGTTYWVQIPSTGTIKGFTLSANPAGTLTVNVSSSAAFGVTNAGLICASACPALSSASSQINDVISGWSTAVAKDGWLYFVINAGAATATQANLTVRMDKL